MDEPMDVDLSIEEIYALAQRMEDTVLAEREVIPHYPLEYRPTDLVGDYAEALRGVGQRPSIVPSAPSAPTKREANSPASNTRSTLQPYVPRVADRLRPISGPSSVATARTSPSRLMLLLPMPPDIKAAELQQLIISRSGAVSSVSIQHAVAFIWFRDEIAWRASMQYQNYEIDGQKLCVFVVPPYKGRKAERPVSRPSPGGSGSRVTGKGGHQKRGGSMSSMGAARGRPPSAASSIRGGGSTASSRKAARRRARGGNAPSTGIATASTSTVGRHNEQPVPARPDTPRPSSIPPSVQESMDKLRSLIEKYRAENGKR